jgi:hypothetical protein
LKEIVKILLVVIGLLPITAIGLFVLGAFIGHWVGDVAAPPPPQWFLISIVLLPVFASLFLRAYKKQKKAKQWLRHWSNLGRREVVGRLGATKTIEELWLETQTKELPLNSPIQRFLEKPLLWGVAALISLLGMAYIFIWLGLVAANR